MFWFIANHLCVIVHVFWFIANHLCVIVHVFWFIANHLCVIVHVFWFTANHLCVIVHVFWLVADHLCVIVHVFWLVANHLWLIVHVLLSPLFSDFFCLKSASIVLRHRFSTKNPFKFLSCGYVFSPKKSTFSVASTENVLPNTPKKLSLCLK